MRHAFNLRRIAEKATRKGDSPLTFYNKLSSAMRGAYMELTDKEMDAVQKAVTKEAESLNIFISTLREMRKKSEKEGN